MEPTMTFTTSELYKIIKDATLYGNISPELDGEELEKAAQYQFARIVWKYMDAANQEEKSRKK